MFGHLLRDVAAEAGICMDYLVFDKDVRTTLAFVKPFLTGTGISPSTATPART